MTLLQPPRDEPKLLADAAVSAPRIVNGLTVRPRKQVNAWHWVGCLLMPDIVALFVLVAIGMHRLLRYLDAERAHPSR
jgi:hypothetical protein